MLLRAIVGDATAIFTTTMHPGDNFRAIATVINDTTGDYNNAQVLAMEIGRAHV